MRRTLVVVTFDENETCKDINRVYNLLLEGAIDKSLHGTTESMYFNHYSAISSVSANWDVPSLGRWDCGANNLRPVADCLGYEIANVSSYKGMWWNSSYPGPLNEKETTAGWPRPDTEAECTSGREVLPSVVDVWGESRDSYNYMCTLMMTALMLRRRACPPLASTMGAHLVLLYRLPMMLRTREQGVITWSRIRWLLGPFWCGCSLQDGSMRSEEGSLPQYGRWMWWRRTEEAPN